MKAHRRISRKLIIGAGALTAFFAAYLYFGLLPGDLKKYAVIEIEKAAPFKVEFSKILYLPFRGLGLYNLHVSDKKGGPVFRTKKFFVDVKILPFLKEKKIIIKNVYLDQPVYDLVLEQPKKAPAAPPAKTKISGEIELPVISDKKKVDISRPEDLPNEFLPENVYLEQIEIINGFMTVRNTAASPVGEVVSDINIRMGFQKPPHLTFDGSLSLGDKPYAFFNLKGSWDLNKADYDFYFDTRFQKIPAWLLEYQQKNFVVLRKAAFVLNAHLKSVGQARASFHAKAGLRDANILANKAEYAGQMAIDVKGVFNFDTKKFETYKGSLDLLKIQISNLSKTISHLDNITGKIGFEPDLLTFERVKGQYNKVFFEAEGAIRSFKELALKATIRTRSSVEQIFSLLPEEQKKLIKDFHVEGSCHSATDVTGSLKIPNGLTTKHKLLIEGGVVRSRDNKVNLSNLYAEIYAGKEGLEIRRSRAISDKKLYSVSAFLPKDPSKSGRLELASEEIKLRSLFKLNERGALFEKALLETYGARISAQGRVLDLKKPYLDIQGEAEADLEKLSSRFSAQAPALKNAGLKGILRGPFTLKGPSSDPWKLDVKWDVKAESLFLLKKIRLTRADAQIRAQNKTVNIPYFRALGYNGSVGLSAFFDLARFGTAFQAKTVLNNVDLRLLAGDLDPKQKDLAGKLGLQMNLSGILKYQDSFRGNGAIDIRDGYLFKTDRFKEMGSLPFVKVIGLDEVVFKAMTATFDIHDKKIWTDNMNLLGTTVNLSMKGNIGFDQNLDLTMNIRYSPDVFNGAEEAGGLAPFMVTQVEEFISDYKVSGPMKDPKYEKVPLPVGRVMGKKISSLFGLAQ